MITVVADTGVIISLAVINKLHLLHDIFGNVFIPQAVWSELSVFIEKYPDISRYFQNKVKNITGINDLLLFADEGEAEAIILCKEIKADYLIIDDKKGRNIAEELGISCIGALGILYKAKKLGLITQLREEFISLTAHRRYYSKEIMNYILQQANEKNIS